MEEFILRRGGNVHGCGCGQQQKANSGVDTMFSPVFDGVLAAIMAVLAVIFFAGKGEGILSAFAGKNAPQRKKRTPEEERRYQRAVAYFLLALTLCEVLMALYGNTYAIVSFITMAVVIAALIILVIYLKKNFPE